MCSCDGGRTAGPTAGGGAGEAADRLVVDGGGGGDGRRRNHRQERRHVPGSGSCGSASVAGGSGVVAADVPGPVRAVRAVPADPGGDPARRRPAVGVLPGGVALQVRQQALHALNMALIFFRARIVCSTSCKKKVPAGR
jgi:hypothetical protein